MGLQHVKNPIRLAREMLIRGERDLEGGNGEHRGPMTSTRDDVTDAAEYGEGKGKGGGGAQGHSQLHKVSAERLAERWGLEIVPTKYFFVQARWDEHIAGLEKEKEGKGGDGNASWDATAYFPQGTCGAVALDADGVLATATSTGGMTNKLTGRIGDTPTLGAGFWAEEWEEDIPSPSFPSTENQLRERLRNQRQVLEVSDTLRGVLADCFPSLGTYSLIPTPHEDLEFRDEKRKRKGGKRIRGAALSGTGNGDSFLRLAAVRTASAIARYRPNTSLQSAVSEITGPGGDLVKSAGDRWKKTGEGEGGIIGIELSVVEGEEGEGTIVLDYNCGGMFRAFVNEGGKAVMRVWKEGQYAGLDIYEGEGKEYDVGAWV